MASICILKKCTLHSFRYLSRKPFLKPLKESFYAKDYSSHLHQGSDPLTQSLGEATYFPHLQTQKLSSFHSLRVVQLKHSLIRKTWLPYPQEVYPQFSNFVFFYLISVDFHYEEFRYECKILVNARLLTVTGTFIHE